MRWAHNDHVSQVFLELRGGPELRGPSLLASEMKNWKTLSLAQGSPGGWIFSTSNFEKSANPSGSGGCFSVIFSGL